MNTDLSLKYVSRPSNGKRTIAIIAFTVTVVTRDDLFSFAPQLDAGIHIISARAPFDIPSGAAWYAISRADMSFQI
jgi:phospholipase/carboxylesterase